MQKKRCTKELLAKKRMGEPKGGQLSLSTRGIWCSRTLSGRKSTLDPFEKGIRAKESEGWEYGGEKGEKWPGKYFMRRYRDHGEVLAMFEARYH